MKTNIEAENHRIYERWHESIVRRDLDGLMSLYANDAVLESAAVLALNGNTEGILHGRDQIASHFVAFFRKLDKTLPSGIVSAVSYPTASS